MQLSLVRSLAKRCVFKNKRGSYISAECNFLGSFSPGWVYTVFPGWYHLWDYRCNEVGVMLHRTRKIFLAHSLRKVWEVDVSLGVGKKKHKLLGLIILGNPFLYSTIMQDMKKENFDYKWKYLLVIFLWPLWNTECFEMIVNSVCI